jgi:hypothetical protein
MTAEPIVTAPAPPIPDETHETPALLGWQRSLLPIMVGVLGVLGAFFIVESVLQVRRVQAYIAQEQTAPPLQMLADTLPANATASQLEARRFRVMTSLEIFALNRRYHQTNLLLMSRVWTRYMGFVTGMTLALVGAVFVLGKLREPGTRIDADRQGVGRVAFESASPGLFLAFFGLVLMIASMVIQVSVDIKDAPVFTAGWVGRPAQAAAPDTSRGSNDAIIMGAKPR